MFRNRIHPTLRSRGFSLIEVLLAIVVLSVGLLALAALQAGLVRNSADAKSRSTASTIAKDVIEDFRDFSTGSEYNVIADSGATAITRGGTTYSRTVTVSRYVLNADPNGDGDTDDGGFAVNGSDTEALSDTPEFKLVDVNVSWVGAAGDTQRVRYFDTISSVDPSDAAQAVSPKPAITRQAPQIRIFPESVAEEGIIPIAIGDEASSAASNPRPQQFNEGVTGTTRFTVQTFNNDTNPLLLQRLDVAATTCKCELDGGTSSDTNLAFEPSFWDGLQYTVPLGVAGKITAVEANHESQDPILCADCCRNHHDKSDSDTLFDPFRPGGDYTVSDNHNHYDVEETTAADTGDEYIESCRMVRVDGIFRVATDTRMENMTLLEMDNSSGTPTLPDTTSDAYGLFAKAYVESAMANVAAISYPTALIPDQLVSAGLPTSLAASHESLLDIVNGGTLDYVGDADVSLTVSGVQNMHARGLYIDYISQDAKDAIACMGDATANPDCDPYRDKELLELTPFLAINMTNLAVWEEGEVGIIEVGEDPVPTEIDEPFERGDVTGLDNGTSEGSGFAFGSNSGLTNEPASDPDDASRTVTDLERFVVGTGVPTPVLPDPFYIEVIGPGTLDDNGMPISVVFPTLTTPDCDLPQGPDEYECQYEDLTNFETTTITIEFGDYNYLATSCGGGGYSVSPTDRCVCVKGAATKPRGFFDFQLTSLSDPVGLVESGTPFVASRAGLLGETSQVTLSVPSQTLELGGLSGLELTATFTAQATACPAAATDP